MMIQLTAGPTAGQRVLLNQSSITIGRASECDVVLDLQHVSRKHAELRFEDDRWWLMNHSTNGTRLGRKLVTKKPRVIAGEAVIAIGSEDVLVVTPHAAQGQAAGVSQKDDEAAADPVADAASRAAKKKQKLWIGIGAYMVLMLGLMVVLSTLDKEADEALNLPEVAILSETEIRRIIREPMPTRAPDERQAEVAAANARDLYALRDSDPDALFRSHQAYMLSKSFASETLAQPRDQRRFQLIEEQLINQTLERYNRAVHMHRSGQFERADREFDNFAQFFPDPQSPIFQNAQKHWEMNRILAKRRK